MMGNDNLVEKLKESINYADNYDNDISISLARRSFLYKNKNAISGIMCILLFIILSVVLLTRISSLQFVMRDIIIVVITVIIAIFCLVKGIFTLLFYFKEKKYDVSVNKFIIQELYNQLYFIYERLFWLWLMIPLILLVLPFICASILRFYLFLIPIVVIVEISLSRKIIKRYTNIKREINMINDDCQG